MPLVNLINTQKTVAEDILSSYSLGQLPQSILFSGPRGSMKLTGALDLAFLLTGSEENRAYLRSQSIILLPHREMMGKVSAAINMFEANRNSSSRLFLIETIRTVLLQYHGALSSALSSSALSYYSVAREIDSILMDYEEEREYTEKETKELIKALRHSCLDPKLLYVGKKNPSPPSIDQVRTIQEYFSTSGENKVVILEDIEDSAEGAKNSLLKMLEEPKEKSHVILLSHNPQRIMETILSRVRKFSFPPLSEKEISSLIKNRFGEWESYPSFDSFFFQKGSGEEKRNEFEKDCLRVSSLLIEGKAMSMEEEESILSSLDALSSWDYFSERMLQEMKKSLSCGRMKAGRGKKILKILNQFIENTETYNMNQRTAFDLMVREALDV